MLSEERSVAAERHKEILSSFLTQQEIVKKHFFEICTSDPSTKASVTETVDPLRTDVLEKDEGADLCPRIVLAPVDRLPDGDLANQDGFGSGSSGPLAILGSHEICIHPGTQNIHSEQPNEAAMSNLPQATRQTTESKLLSSKSELNFGRKESLHASTCRGEIRQIVSSDRFEICVAGLIIANAFVMCFEVQRAGIQIGCRLQYRGCGEDVDNVWPGSLRAFEITDWLFGTIFAAEALLKIIVFARRYFFEVWNCLDFLCVMVFVMDKAASAFLSLDSQALRMLRLFRLVRLIKLLRSLESLDALYLMTTALQGMALVVVWACGLLVVMLTTCALFLTTFMHSAYFGGVTSDTASDAHHKLYEYFGTTTRCFLTMFEMTLANWPLSARLLTEEISEWFTPICLIHKLIFGFAVVGVINGVILQETFRVASTDDFIMVRHTKREQAGLRQKLQSLFRALDISEDGEVEFAEFQIISSHPDVVHWLSSMGIETSDLQTLFDLIDVDCNGTVSLQELVEEMPRIRGTARSIDLLALRRDQGLYNHTFAARSDE